MTTAIKDLVDSSGNPTEITISYNGIVFGPLVKFHIEAMPEYDPTRRVTVYEKYRLHVVSWESASSESAMGDRITDRREKLLQPGGQLKISQVGFGDINTSSQTPDLAWGPHPQQASFTMLGGAVMWQLEWSCEFRLNHCASSSGSVRAGASPLSFFSYDVVYSHDDLGFTTRAIQAVLKIPQIQSGHRVRDIPEKYRNKLSVPVPAGYRRVRYDQASNAAQDELRITIVDQQLRTEPFPVGIAHADVRFAISSQSALTNTTLSFSVTGEMETIPGFPKSLAQTRFFQIVFARLAILRNAVRGAIIPMRLDMSHHPFDRRSSFSFSFSVAGAGPDEVYNPKILYQPMEGLDWYSWANGTNGDKSLARLWGPDGQTGLHTGSTNLVDQCNKHRTVSLDCSSGSYPLGDPASDQLPSAYFTCENISAERSWMWYETQVEYSRVENVRINKRDVYLDIPFLNVPINFSAAGRSMLGTPVAPVGDTVVRTGAPEQLVIIKGKALRVRFPIEIPKYKSIEGVELAYIGGKEAPMVAGSLFGCPTTFAKWIQVYRAMGDISAKVKAVRHPNLEVAN